MSLGRPMQNRKLSDVGQLFRDKLSGAADELIVDESPFDR
jgi:hypothetical protein